MFDHELKPSAPEQIHPLGKPEFSCPPSLKGVQDIFKSCSDLEQRELFFGLDGKIKLSLCWLDGLVGGMMVSDDVIRPLTERLRSYGAASEEQCLELILHGAVYSYTAKQRSSMDEIVSDLCHGFCALFFEELKLAVCFEVRSPNVRSVSQPDLERSVKGAKDAFVETLRINTSLVRKRLASPKLKLLESTVGRKSRTRVAMMFMEGVAREETVAELAARLDRLDVDTLLATGGLEEYIVDRPRSPLPQLMHTERPDRFAMELSAGRVGLLVDGIPIGLLLPVGLGDFLRVTGDSCNNYIIASILSLLRCLSMFISILLPGLYVAVAMYHQEMIPTRLLLSMIEAKQNVPFSTGLEILGMLIAFELLQEAGLRLPDPIGDTVSIIGALIVGQSAVEAQVISPIAIIVVAVSGIASYTLPSQDLGACVRLLRFALVLAAIWAGLFGVGMVFFLSVLHLCSIESFGMSYASPLSDAGPFPLLKMLLKPPKPADKYRDPRLVSTDRRRQR